MLKKTSFENIYDTYCPMLYSIALQLCSDTIKVEKIFVLTFKKIYQQDLDWPDKKPFCIDLIKLLIQTAKEELYPGEIKGDFKIRQFEKTPLLHKLLVEQLTLESYCAENNISYRDAVTTIREEFALIRNVYQKNTFVPDMSYQLN